MTCELSNIPELQIEEAQKSIRTEIITSVAANGILSEKKLHESDVSPLASADAKTPESFSRYIYGALIISQNHEGVIVEEKKFGNHEVSYPFKNIKGKNKIAKVEVRGEDLESALMYEALFGHNKSVMPVLAERLRDNQGPTSEYLTDDVIQDRLENSMLVVTPIQKTAPMHIGELEVHCVDQIEAGKITAALVPEKLYREAKELFQEFSPDILVISVPSDTKRMFKNRRVIEAPDYEGVISKLRDNSKQPLFVHGVRLPTMEDARWLISKES